MKTEKLEEALKPYFDESLSFATEGPYSCDDDLWWNFDVDGKEDCAQVCLDSEECTLWVPMKDGMEAVVTFTLLDPTVVVRKEGGE